MAETALTGEEVGAPSRPDTARPIVIFDGTCNLCNGSVNFILRHDRRGLFLFAPNQTPAGQRLLQRFGYPTQDVGSLLLVEGERVSSKTTAALRIARLLGFPICLAYLFIFVPAPVRDWAYGILARNRYRWFGRAESCRLPTPEETARFVTE